MTKDEFDALLGRSTADALEHGLSPMVIAEAHMQRAIAMLTSCAPPDRIVEMLQELIVAVRGFEGSGPYHL